jgi:predicted Zn-ribbon and HTH transcriptional regulator
MTRSTFSSILLGLVGLSALSGCKSRISKSAYDSALGDPYKCSKCGHLIRSTDDLEGTRCPRCYAKALERISEEEMAAALVAE